MIAIEGTLQTSNYTDKNGNQRKQVEVLANNVSFCGPKPQEAPSAAPAPTANEADFEVIDDDDDLPF